ncbi:MAG: TrbC/VirB2 family protein [Clostridia bacterium]
MKKIIVCCIFTLFLACSLNFAFAGLGDKFDEGNLGTTENAVNAIEKPVENIWSIVTICLQVASVSGVVIAGIKYMYTSADGKAELKKTLVPLVIGMIIVFAGSTVVQFIQTSFTEITVKTVKVE